MGGLNPFAKPKVPLPPEAPPAPTRDDSMFASISELEKLKKQRGRAATMLTGGKGVVGDDMAGLATKKLLGG